MSYQFIAKIICDRCAAEIIGDIQTRSTYQAQSFWTAKDAAKAAGWVVLNRGKYRTEQHYCRKCADTAPATAIQPPPLTTI